MLLRPDSSLPLCLLTATALLNLQLVAAFTYAPLAAPLAVKSPFLNTWLTGEGPLAGNWARNAMNMKITGWNGMVRVDGVGYIFLGAGTNAVDFIGRPGDVLATSVTPTQTIFTVRCGGVDISAAFLSPIEPTDFVRLSLPFSYLSVTATPNDGAQHRVQVYSDMSAEWLSDVTSNNITWSTKTTSAMVYHEFAISNSVQYSAQNGRVMYGTGYHGILLEDGVTYQTAADVGMRSGFNMTGILNNTQDNGFRQIDDQWPCFALSKDLGTINAASSPVVFAVGLTRDPAISYQVNSGPQARTSYYRTQFATDQDALSFFLNDYPTALASANIFDSKLVQVASQISPNYVDLVTLAARQTFSSVELTVTIGSDGKLNTSEPLLFIGPTGVNKIDTIYAAAPFWAWVNPDLLRLLIEPALKWYQNIGGSRLNYVVDDLGDSYPRAIGPSSTAFNSPKSLESTGDMMIITSAFVRASGDKSIVSENADLYKTWGDYLKDNALYPGTQKTSDDEVTGSTAGLVNNTNLAVKGIVALKAYADILTSLGQDGSAYSRAAASYASTWQTLAATSTGFASSYNDPNSWSMVYNLFLDKWLKTGLFPDAVFQKLGSQYSLHTNNFGVPLRSGTTVTSAQWMMFAAGLVPDTETRDVLISKAQSYIQNGPIRAPWGSSFETLAGNTTEGTYGSPSVGGVYALLVRDFVTSQGPPTSSPSGASLTLSGMPLLYQLVVAAATLFVLQ